MRWIGALEARTLLAANVTAELVNGTLIVTGEEAANHIEIQGELFNSRTFILTGDGATTVDGSPDAASFSDVKQLLIPAHGGDDSVLISDINVRKDLRADLGGGNDVLTTRRGPPSTSTGIAGQVFFLLSLVGQTFLSVIGRGNPRPIHFPMTQFGQVSTPA